jgi:hypothetical protein
LIGFIQIVDQKPKKLRGDNDKKPPRRFSEAAMEQVLLRGRVI